ncbi:MAG: aminodeoxychorismate/anthranilate synthase component II [Bacteroidales bacterium]|nr:aminodeoxychorismate/anthranilate synthase component II [Bacteroidales bacterium]
MKVLLLDNYDSFTYNLKQLIDQFGGIDLDVIKNDQLTIEQAKKYDKIMLSPGPGLPRDAGIMPQLIKHYAATKPILGVCLGHHAIAEAFGGKLYNFEQPVHGISRQTTVLKNDLLFKNIPLNFSVGLYHSWAVSEANFPSELEIISRSEMGVIMAIRHVEYNVKGLQFHPESIMTPNGKTMIWNWLAESF